MCGVILAKMAVAGQGARTVVQLDPPRNVLRRVYDRAFHAPERIDRGVLGLRAALLLFFAWWGLRLIAMDVANGELASSFLHGPLLVFHEAGHVLFSFCGEFMTILGGSLLQLLLPAALVVAFLWKNEDPFGAALGLWFFGVSLLDLAPYIYDALHPQLVLLGGHTGAAGGHDWIYLLDAFGARSAAQTLGWLAHKLGALVVLAALAWAALLLNKQRGRV
jgi:hypothetical protein